MHLTDQHAGALPQPMAAAQPHIEGYRLAGNAQLRPPNLAIAH
jgi:hypothetical protein